MSRKLWLLVSCGVLAVLLTLNCTRNSISFTTLDNARTEIVAVGYHCTSDRKDGKIGGGFVVTREPLDWTEVCDLRRPDRPKQPWTGKAWVTWVDSLIPIPAGPDEQSARVWGKVVAFGDDAFLDELEGALRPTSRCL
jgi:hypothetical protein